MTKRYNWKTVRMIETTMKKNILIPFLFCVLPLQAQTLTVGDVFREMPDSIVPYLTENNRLDMLDFMASHMKAVVQNRFEGHSEMLTLTDDSLSLRLSDALRMTIRLVDSRLEVDGARLLIRVDEQVGIPTAVVDNKCTFYSIKWRKLAGKEVDLVK